MTPEDLDCGPVLARTLSLALAPPETATLDAVARLAGLLVVGDLVPALGGCLDALRHRAAAVSRDELSGEYEAIFGGSVRCSPYEGSYERDPFRQARVIADLRGFYAAFGAEPSGPATERADHVGCQLEFLALVGGRRLSASDPATVEVCRAAEDAVLRDHLGRFLGRLADEVAAISTEPFYRATAEIAREYLARELAARSLTPVPLTGGRPRSDLDADELTCGAGCVTACATAAGARPQDAPG